MRTSTCTFLSPDGFTGNAASGCLYKRPDLIKKAMHVHRERRRAVEILKTSVSFPGPLPGHRCDLLKYLLAIRGSSP